MEGEYRIVLPNEALQLRDESSTCFQERIPWNQSYLYKLGDGKYLVMPMLGAFCPSILVADHYSIEQFITDEYFPDGDKLWLYYKEHKDFYNDLNNRKSELICDLLAYCKFDLSVPIDIQTVDAIWEIIKKRRTKAKYRLHFCLLVCEYFISRNDAYYIDTVTQYQTLNPTIHIVLSNKEDEQIRFNIEDDVFGKWGFSGMYMTSISVENRMKISKKKSDNWDNRNMGFGSETR